ncbi:MAG: tetratricopeptide repeat protein [Pseudomonadota bacterium]
MRTFLTLMLFFHCAFAQAAWRDWWVGADQQGVELLRQEKPAEAVEKFANPEWRGIAQFQAGDAGAAAESFLQSPTQAALYNRATVLAHSGELEQSLAAFDELLKHAPNHEDGIANREWVLQQMQQQTQNSADPSNSEQGDEGQNEQGGDDQNAQQNGQAQEGAQNQNTAMDERQAQAQSGRNDPNDSERDAMNELKNALQQQFDGEQETVQQAHTKNPSNPNQGQQQQAMIEQPFDESAQAVEQQLQRIPDDPAGLLRNKLYVTHQSRFADIVESESW